MARSKMYEELKLLTYTSIDGEMYERIGKDMSDIDKFGLSIEQTEILYNIEYYKTLNDIAETDTLVGGDRKRRLKREWLEEWKEYMTKGFSGFINVKGVELHWYSTEELLYRIARNSPTGVWYRLVLLEAMLFEPYFTISTEKDRKGNEIPSKKYDSLQVPPPLGGYDKSKGDVFLQKSFAMICGSEKFIVRLRKCYGKVMAELNEVLKTTLISLGVGAFIAIAVAVTAGAFAPAIATLLVGSNFAGLSGAALTSACLAYLGGGAIAAGGLGMAGGTMVIVGGGAILGLGIGAGAGGAIGAMGVYSKRAAILQSAKLLVSIREIFLNDEKDLAFSGTVLEKYAENIAKLQMKLLELRTKAGEAGKEEQKKINADIKELEDSLKAMELARKSMNRFISSFGEGLGKA